MSKRYFVWKDSACGGINIEWVELTSKEFISMARRPENKGRRFIRFGNEVSEDDDVIYMEATEPQYLRWRKEKNAQLYRRRVNSAYQTLSLDGPIAGSEDALLEDTVADTERDTEESAIRHLEVDRIREVLPRFTKEELWIIEAIYVEKRTATEVAAELGVSQPAVSKRAKRLLKRLKNYFEN